MKLKTYWKILSLCACSASAFAADAGVPVALASTPASSAPPSPVATENQSALSSFIAAGIDFLPASMRALTSHVAPHLAVGELYQGEGLFGTPSLDLDWERAAGNGNQINVVNVSLCERRSFTQGLGDYVGLGIGACYERIKIEDQPGISRKDHGFSLSGRVMVGTKLDARVFCEIAYVYSGTRRDDIDTNAVSACLGVKF